MAVQGFLTKATLHQVHQERLQWPWSPKNMEWKVGPRGLVTADLCTGVACLRVCLSVSDKPITLFIGLMSGYMCTGGKFEKWTREHLIDGRRLWKVPAPASTRADRLGRSGHDLTRAKFKHDPVCSCLTEDKENKNTKNGFSAEWAVCGQK